MTCSQTPRVTPFHHRGWPASKVSRLSVSQRCSASWPRCDGRRCVDVGCSGAAVAQRRSVDVDVGQKDHRHRHLIWDWKVAGIFLPLSIYISYIYILCKVHVSHIKYLMHDNVHNIYSIIYVYVQALGETQCCLSTNYHPTQWVNQVSTRII